MPEIGQKGRLLYAVGVGLFGVALAAGVVQSLRIDGRLPAIDLLANGSEAYINRLLAREDHKGAIEQLEIQSRIFPYDADTHKRVGKLLWSEGRPEEARAHFQEFVRLRPDDAEGHCFLGSSYINTSDPALAAPCFAEAIRLSPQFPKAYDGLGLALAQLGEVAEAEKCFAKAVELAPDFMDAQNHLKQAREELRKSPDGAKKGKGNGERPSDQ